MGVNYSDEVVAAVCRRLAMGESLRSICSGKGMPDKSTWYDWLDTHEGLEALYRKALRRRADTHADEVVDIADQDSDPQRARVRIDARKWYAGRMNAPVYGEPSERSHGVDKDEAPAAVEVTVVDARVRPDDHADAE
jgi:hypothetical protein